MAFALQFGGAEPPEPDAFDADVRLTEMGAKGREAINGFVAEHAATLFSRDTHFAGVSMLKRA